MKSEDATVLAMLCGIAGQKNTYEQNILSIGLGMTAISCYCEQEDNVQALEKLRLVIKDADDAVVDAIKKLSAQFN